MCILIIALAVIPVGIIVCANVSLTSPSQRQLDAEMDRKGQMD